MAKLGARGESWWLVVGGNGGNGGKLTVKVATLTIGGNERARFQVKLAGEMLITC